ncbi:AAA family ATPase [Lachnoclostridium sp. An14]|uniref:ATP-binding protein n=1 Tax=Lachnoclostridium sp. An14 TaxID=1965562 RepID=UPI000B3969F4|nr:ATP-binding protein [Lachnoclostridium sp. An14]OUQ17620.1 AAA family ATPase [Lachnoclostridium sp. An14]
MESTHTLSSGLHSLVIFRNLLNDPVISRLLALLDTDPSSGAPFVDAYCEFASALLARTDDFSQYLLGAALEDENFYVTGAGSRTSGLLDSRLETELKFLQRLSQFDGSGCRSAAPDGALLPVWTTSPQDFVAAYRETLENLPQKGYGIYAKYHVFTVSDGRLVPVRHPDPQRLSQLSGYEAERGKVIANTLALLEGRPAVNALLYGDAGTGKSSTVKAIANEYAHRGLRLIEVKKNQLYQIPDLMDSLSANPLKFILFIDDLSFSSNDNDFAALKAILEGSVSSHGPNLVVYATSNRRHLIKESFADREGDDLHLADTMQELLSLSARFGLTVTFSRPDKDLYLQIVEDLAALYELSIDRDELIRKAESFAIRSGGRSPRTAKQLIEQLKSLG